MLRHGWCAIVLGIMLAWAGSCASFQAAPPSPAATRPYVPPVPVPTPDHPNAYNYLNPVLRLATGTEYAFLSALNAQPLAQPRPLLERLGIIQDRKLVPTAPGSTGNYYDEGELRALNDRQRFAQALPFDSPTGPRQLLVFEQPNVAVFAYSGPDDAVVPATLILTDANWHVLTWRQLKVPFNVTATVRLENAQPILTLVRIKPRHFLLTDQAIRDQP